MRTLLTLIIACTMPLVRAVPWTTLAVAQEPTGSTQPAAQRAGPSLPLELGLDTTTLAGREGGELYMLLEKTLFKVDVLTLRVRVGPATATRLETAAAIQNRSEAVDSVAAIALRARDVWAEIVFRRDIGLERFLDGIGKDLGRALEAGIIEPEEYRNVWGGLPEAYGFLAETGIRRGDRMYYRIRGDTLRTIYQRADGDVPLDQVDTGPGRRLAVLGGWFAPGSSFRRRLAESILP